METSDKLIMFRRKRMSVIFLANFFSNRNSKTLIYSEMRAY